jgi:phosphoribosylglycinamide formyltransferase-1
VFAQKLLPITIHSHAVFDALRLVLFVSRMEAHGCSAFDTLPDVKKLGILLSGRGSNFLAIADSVAAGKIPAEIAVVISNREAAPGIEAARARGLNALLIASKGKLREQHDREVMQALREHKVDLICLAGYMRLLSPEFIRAFPQRILNIHPSLLPAFPGLEAQKQALEYGAKITGCTVHFVDEHLDHGPIILQRAVPVLDDDDVETLSARILKQEHIAYSEAIRRVLAGGWHIEGRRVVFASEAWEGPSKADAEVGKRLRSPAKRL